jgi:hypothetical protein
MRGFKSFVKNAKKRNDAPDTTLEYSTGGLPATDGKCPEGFAFSNTVGGCVPEGPVLHDMSMPEVGNSYPPNTPKNV